MAAVLLLLQAWTPGPSQIGALRHAHACNSALGKGTEPLLTEEHSGSKHSVITQPAASCTQPAKGSSKIHCIAIRVIRPLHDPC